MNNQQSLKNNFALQSLRIRNFKCFEDQILRFRSLTLLSGLNGTGKSSVIQSLLLLRQSYEQGLLQNTGLALNGDLVHIGTALDALFEGAKGDSISFRSTQCWEQNNLELTLLEIDEEGELREHTSLKVAHACCVEHVQQHEHWIRGRIQLHAQLSVSDGNDLWAHKEALFPNLQFCDAVQKQLRGILRGNLLLHPIMKKLFALNTYCENWHDGPFDCHKISGKVTPESDITLGKYPNEHTLLCPDGVNRLFSWHARLTPGAWRIYFFVDEEKHLLTVGHIGHKFPNMLYPT
jgi:AAA ATPase domain